MAKRPFQQSKIFNILNYTRERKDELDFDCIFGINGHIFEVSNGWFALEPQMPFLATGSGMKYAMGSLYTTQPWKDPIQRINVALSSAAEYAMTVSAPFTILEK